MIINDMKIFQNTHNRLNIIAKPFGKIYGVLKTTM